MNDDLPGFRAVMANGLSAACALCRRGVDRQSFRIAADSALMDAAYDRLARDFIAIGGMPNTSIRIDQPAWICSRCAEARSRCETCGQPLAAMRPEFRWFIDDDGLVTCNPYVRDPYSPPVRPGACVNPACRNYSSKAAGWFLRARRRAIGYQGFSDPYAAILGDAGVRPGELRRSPWKRARPAEDGAEPDRP